MTKIKFVKHPKSIVKKRHDHSSSLFVTIPKKIVREWKLEAGQIVEFSTVMEGQDISVKVRKV